MRREIVALVVLGGLLGADAFGQTSRLALRMTEPTGPGSVRVAVRGLPNEGTFTALSVDPLNASAPGAGVWQGLHIDVNVLVGQLLFNAPPFITFLDGSGEALFELPAGSVGSFVMPLWGVTDSPTSFASKVARYPHPWPTAEGFGFAAVNRHAALGDIDLDGDLDLVNSAGVHFGDGALGFATVAADPTGVEARLVDLLGDPHPELVVFEQVGFGLKIYPGNGTGDFASQTPLLLPVTASDFGQLKVDDLDNDGDQDLLLATGATTSTGLIEFLQLAPGVFVDVGTFTHPASLACASGDFNGDGKTDFFAHEATVGFAAERLWLYIGNFVVPNGAHGQRVERTAALPTPDTRWLEAGDVNGDGHLDLVWRGRFEVGVLLGDGGFNFTYASWAPAANCCGGDPATVTARDLDGDGDLDLAWIDGGDTLVIGWNDGTGLPEQVETWPLAGSSGNHLLVGDLDGDGDQDLIAGGIPSTLFDVN